MFLICYVLNIQIYKLFINSVFMRIYLDGENVMTRIARYTRPINGAPKGNAMWLVDFPHCSSMNEGMYIVFYVIYNIVPTCY